MNETQIRAQQFNAEVQGASKDARIAALERQVSDLSAQLAAEKARADAAERGSRRWIALVELMDGGLVRVDVECEAPDPEDTQIVDVNSSQLTQYVDSSLGAALLATDKEKSK